MARTSHFGLLLAASLGCCAIPAGGEPLSQDLGLPASYPGDSSEFALAEAAKSLAVGRLSRARQLIDRLAEAGEGGPQRDFLDGMISYAGRDYRRAETMFRRILDRDPKLLRVRLELARTLYMQRKDDQADYHFRLVAGEHPSEGVLRNITHFREEIRARRAWRFNFDFGFAPDSNINSATDKQTVDIYGLPFRLDPGGRARSGTGKFFGGDASLRLNRFGNIPIYLGAYGRSTRYSDHRFDDAYVGAEAGPEFQVAGGTLRMTAAGLKRWYGKRPLVTSIGTHLDYERVVGDKWTLGAALLIRHNNYAYRRDVDGWDAEARVSAERPLGPTVLGFAYVSAERSWANDPGQAYWRERLGVGIRKEIGWGLRPQLNVEVARQVNDGPLAPFGEQRRDWLLQGSFSIYKRDWNLGGFAPSVHLTLMRNLSTLTLYDEKRLRSEVRLTKAF